MLYLIIRELFKQLDLNDLIKNNSICLENFRMLELIFLAVLEGLLILFKELELSLSEFWGSQKGLGFIEDRHIFGRDRVHDCSKR
jgi:hypothetical protein